MYGRVRNSIFENGDNVMEEKKNNTKSAENKDSRKITLEHMQEMAAQAAELKKNGDEELIGRFEKAIFEFSKVDTKELMDGMQKILDELEEENKDK